MSTLLATNANRFESPVPISLRARSARTSVSIPLQAASISPAVTALAVGVVIGLAKFIGPLAAGFIGMLIFAAIAGGLGWYGAERLRREL